MSSPPQRSPLLSSEDWISVWIGFAFLALAVVGVRPDLPAFGWTAEEPLKAFAGANLQSSLLLGVFFLAVSLPGVALMGARAASYLVAFPAKAFSDSRQSCGTFCPHPTPRSESGV